MTKPTILTMAQQNYLLGGIEHNCELIIAAIEKSRDEMAADIIIFPELAITGYPPEDLLLRPVFCQQAEQALLKIRQCVDDIHVVIGHPCVDHQRLFNVASVIHNHKIVARYKKQVLPNYGVFDEKRYFHAGRKPCVLPIKGVNFGLLICEDVWQPGLVQQTIAQGAQILICLNASPFHEKKLQARKDLLRERQQQEGAVPIIYVNSVGGQDELVFDGNSLAMDATGQVCVQAPAFEAALVAVEINQDPKISLTPTTVPPELPPEATIYQALILGIRDYVHKNGFKKVLLGLSGGIDSALTLAIASDALGAENVQAVLLPSRYTSQTSVEDAIEQCQRSRVKHHTLPIEPMFAAAMQTLSEGLAHEPVGVTTENLQARCRAILLMALSNQTGALLLTTGNKSEMAVGYATLYGDMCGAFSVLKDVLKTRVYRLAKYRNSLSAVIPQRVIDRPPSAELAHGQTDQDTLPEYKVLDEIIIRYVEKNESEQQIIQAGFEPETVTKTIALIDKSEYKRRQAAPGVRISSRAFGRDWRHPITAGFILDPVVEMRFKL